jgi:selenocysteine-specific elongation factor
MVNELIIGTAGHVDHGKTTLIKALTGKDTDRLKEEKERGISIELGFAHFILPSGKRIGIVDVPGHERFLRHMLAGVGGMDMVLLVIAADEGVMPQTKEHMQILQLLGVRTGIVVLTKSDTVDREWLDMVEEDVRLFLRDTVLERAPICRVASITGQGITALIQCIETQAITIIPRPNAGAFRMPIDRVFTMQGFGTVVTGTLWSGMINEGDKAVIEPGGLDVRVRGIQVYSKKVAAACAGQRTALNLAGVEVEDLTRGHVIVKAGVLIPSHMIDARLVLLKDTEIKELHNGTRVRFYTGTSETIGRVYLLDQERLQPGETALVQIRLESTVAVCYGDHYVLRLYSPMITMGGGIILEPDAGKRRRFDTKTLEVLRGKEAGAPDTLIYQTIAEAKSLVSFDFIIKRFSQFTMAQTGEWLHTLVEDGRVKRWDIDGVNYFLDRETELHWLEEITEHLAAYHRNFPLRTGIPREELRQKFFKKLTQKQFQTVLGMWQQLGRLHCEGQKIRLSSHQVIYKGLHKQWQEKIEREYINHLFSPPENVAILPNSKNKEAAEVWDSLLERGIIVRIAEGMYFHQHAIVKAQEALEEYFATNERLTPADFRDLIGSSRKYCVPLLEHFDNIGVTKRINEYRIQSTECKKRAKTTK